MNYLSKRSTRNLDTCHQDLITIFRAAITDSPYDFAITHGYRSLEKQNKLYQKGRTIPGKIVTFKDGYNNKSKHNSDPSMAVDIAIYYKRKIVWEREYYKIVSRHILKIAEELLKDKKINNALDWGGRFRDYPHYQI